jgi:hypothetical protein
MAFLNANNTHGNMLQNSASGRIYPRQSYAEVKRQIRLQVVVGL